MILSTTNDKELKRLATSYQPSQELNNFAQFGIIFSLFTVFGLLIHQIYSQAHLLQAAPIYSDDFMCLSATWNNFHWVGARPGVFAIVWAIGLLGPKYCHLANCLIAITYFTMVLLFISKWLQLPKIPPSLACFAIIGTLSYEHIVQCYHYTCVFAFPLSGILALATIYLIYKSITLQTGWLISYIAALALVPILLCIREDFYLPILIFCFYHVFFSKGEISKQGQIKVSIALGFFIIVGIGVFIQQHFFANSPFFSGSGPYQTNFTPGHILSMIWQYLTCTTGSKIAATVQLLSFIAGLAMNDKILPRKLLFLHIIICSLILPYSVLTDAHYSKDYAINWIPWQFASSFVFAFLLPPFSGLSQYISWAIAGILSLFIIQGTQLERQNLLFWFADKDQISRRALTTLFENREKINRYPVVAITGSPPALGPWTFTNSDFLKNRMKLNCRWLVFTDPSTDYYKINQVFQYTEAVKLPTIERHKASELKSYPLTAVLKFSANGSGTFIEPTYRKLP